MNGPAPFDGLPDPADDALLPEVRRRHRRQAAGDGPPAGVLDVIDTALRAYAPGPPRDDKALLAIKAER